MTRDETREAVVASVRQGMGGPTYKAESRILIAAAQIIRSCTMNELLCISATTADAGDLWGAKALADFEIKRRETYAGTLRDSRKGTLPADAG